MSTQDCTAAAPISKEVLRAQIRRFLDEDASDDDFLMDFGLNSISVMELVSAWKAARLEVSFVELAGCATFNDFWDLLSRKSAALDQGIPS